MTERHTSDAKTWALLLALCVGLLAHTSAAAPLPAAKIKQIKDAIKRTTLVASHIKLSLQLGHVYRQHKAYDKALATYRALGKKYRKRDVQCIVYHFSAQTLLTQKKQAAAHAMYKKLIGAFRGCQCRYTPNAYIALGRAAFDQKQYKKALGLYGKAPRCKENRIGAIAAGYMKGWCAYKLGRYPQSLRSLQQTLGQLRRQRRRFKGAQRKKLQEIQREGLPNLVRAFNRAGNPARAFRTFKQVADGPQIDKMLKQLSDSYHTTKSYKKLLALYQRLARIHRRSPKLVRDQLEILRAAYRLGLDKAQLRALRDLKKAIATFHPKSGWSKLLKADIADAQDQLHRFAMGKHRAAQKSNNTKLYRQSEAFFTAYRTLFPKAKDAHKKAYWHGEALLTLKQFARAADAYSISARSAQPFKHKEDAAYKAALARHRLLRNQRPLQYKAPTSNKPTKPHTLPKKFKQFIEAGTLYCTRHPAGKKVPYVTYNMGLAYQIFGHFGQARAAFVEVVQKHPRTRYARPAAYHVVDTLRLRQRWAGLHKWATTFATMANFGTPLFKKQMLRMSRAAQMKRCFALDSAKAYAKAGGCYEAMARVLGKHKDTPILLYNAYVAFHNGKKNKEAKAMKAQLLKQYPGSRPARMLKR